MTKISSLTDLTSSKNFGQVAAGLYGDGIGQLQRYSNLYVSHTANFPERNEGSFYSSSGRVEIVGNHTDHNCGKVLTAAITVDKLAFVTASDDNIVEIVSDGFDKIICPLDKLDVVEEEKGGSLALVKGVAKWLIDNGFAIGGFKATVTSNVPAGSGVSSSASFEVLVAEIFNDLYNGGALTGVQKAMASQYAENVFFGKPCGLMDQSAIAIGGVSMIDFKKKESPEVVNVDWTFGQMDIVLTNTGGSHADLTDAYASIRYEMEEIASYFGVETLRDVEYQKLMAEIPVLRTKYSGRAILRAMHYFDENLRVDRAVAAITYKNAEGFLKVVNESGDSSFKLLQNCYVPEDLEERIPLAIAISKRTEGVLAARVHGGGFAGTMIAFVERGSTAAYVKKMESVFGVGNSYKMGIRKEGACRVDFD